jgi:hypothetical protein
MLVPQTFVVVAVSTILPSAFLVRDVCSEFGELIVTMLFGVALQ